MYPVTGMEHGGHTAPRRSGERRRLAAGLAEQALHARPVHPAAQWAYGAGSVLLVAVIGYVDYITGWAVSFSVFYLIPIALATWYLGGPVGLTVALLSTLSWYFADRATSPLHANSLIPIWNALVRFGFYLIVNRTLAALRAALARTAELARTDHLTGLDNGRSFAAAASAELERARRTGHPITIAFLDLDDFKAVNDRLGHIGADDALTEWARGVRGQLRSSDAFARIGGDEFVILLPETGHAAAAELLPRLHARLLAAAGNEERPISFSMGAITFLSPPVTVDDLLRPADALMYVVKAAGKGGWRHEVVG